MVVLNTMVFVGKNKNIEHRQKLKKLPLIRTKKTTTHKTELQEVLLYNNHTSISQW